MKQTLEVIEKLLLVLTLILSVGASGWKGYEYISAKSLVVKAKAKQEQEIGNAQQLLTKTYAELLSNLDKDIRQIDSKLAEELYEGTVGWDKLLIIRKSKVEDRNHLLQQLGGQVSNIMNSSRYAPKSSENSDG
ncbi:hypothetical protein G3495_14055 [Shewanella baltica]|uniref:hypothetical protein n=1 Tax=Shewanella baltica TaxID=62322 RepID=UPI00217E5CBC|nr:hypothetical protein [Shewanella baltica]MCS6236240.1 hypothetical protein [Shewanella baltica]MCS6270647.1 hypothetical protein [Shewanella baltica]